MTMTWITNWYNLIFAVPLALALVYLGLYTLSGWTFGDSDVDADADGHFEASAHFDADAGHEPDIIHDHHLGHGDGHAANGSVWLAVLTWFGVGKVPLSILLMLLLMTWGVIGFAANTYTRENTPQLAQPWLLSVPLAAVGSLLLTKLFASLVGRFLPMNETYARRRHEFLGSVAEVILPTDRKFGMVMVRDARGEMFQLPCRLEAGERTIEKGTKVKLVAYNATEKLFYVMECDEGVTSSIGDATRGRRAHVTE